MLWCGCLAYPSVWLFCSSSMTARTHPRGSSEDLRIPPIEEHTAYQTAREESGRDMNFVGGGQAGRRRRRQASMQAAGPLSPTPYVTVSAEMRLHAWFNVVVKKIGCTHRGKCSILHCYNVHSSTW